MQGPQSPWRDDTAGYRPAAAAEGQGDEEATRGKLKICKAEREAGLWYCELSEGRLICQILGY